jgi:hypothetical protein
MPSDVTHAAAAAVAFFGVQGDGGMAALPDAVGVGPAAVADAIAEGPDADQPVEMAARGGQACGYGVCVVQYMDGSA